MTGTPRRWDWARLADHVIARRADLGMTRRDLAAATGVSERSIGKMERGESVSRDTVAKTEIALRWEQGSGRRIAEGGEASEAGGTSDRSADPSYRDILDSEHLTEGEKLAAIEAIEKRRARVRDAGFTEDEQEILRQAPGAYKILMDRKRARDRGVDDAADGESA